MAIKIGSNFTFQGEQPNFERDRFATKAAMKAFPETSIDDGHLSYCAEDGNTYQFKSSNSVDAVTGKWRVFKDGFGADTISTEPNQFLAGPINTKGNIGLRKIDITDIPDLSSKYATKEKAFTKDTVSTAPGQFVAGPATTQGNLYLRKLIADDIPDLKSKYQPINGNGIQEGPRAVGLSVGYKAQIGYLKALISVIDTTSQVSPDWYYATDGTLQDIKTKIPKVTLDDAVSTTSDNGVKNSVITKYVDGKVTTINSSITDVRTSLESTQTDFVDLRNKVNAMPKVEFVTQEKYTADKEAGLLDANTIYYIK